LAGAFSCTERERSAYSALRASARSSLDALGFGGFGHRFVGTQARQECEGQNREPSEYDERFVPPEP
jgi:hypothetical protein